MKKQPQPELKPRRARLPVAGEKVTFHVLTAHTCSGVDCQCTPDLHLPATIKHAYDATTFALDVHFPSELLALEPDGSPVVHEARSHIGKCVRTAVTVHGFIGYQSRVARAQQEPAESGSWTFQAN